MNTSFGSLKLVNSYGAFGSITRVRNEVVLQGTSGDPNDPYAEWIDYEMKCKPGPLLSRISMVRRGFPSLF